MQTHTVTTPVGRRPMTLALVKVQLDAAEIPAGKSAQKWKVFRDACEARSLLGVQDRSLAVLNALLTFYPHNDLTEERGLVVFPSNAQLSIRAHGIAGTTLRRHLAALVDAGLISRKDSPNGKRYAHRDRSGEVENAFGFSLAPLLARAEELAQMAQEVAEIRRRYLMTKEALSTCRRDVRKLISAAVEEGQDGDWPALEDRYRGLAATIPRSSTTGDLQPLLEEMEMLRDEVVNCLKSQIDLKKTNANDVHYDHHKQNSNTESINELEPSFETQQAATPVAEPQPVQPAVRPEPPKAFPLGMVLKACPDIADYGPGGAISSWRELMTAAVVVRSMLGVSPSAYQEACEVLGPENAAVAVACILERAGHINSPGGYLRDLTRRAARGEFSLGPMLMALMRTGGPARRAAS
ncbi:replication initiation protein RepC [Rhizobium sp. TRM95111]|uniref:plasmid replication protein RepC n=1 Tax=Rhizobium alarense TaxID=2846851 RepID=UPI001F240708|nr:plasmid replication protein RepC [Rhizobium alarense]MCF3640288.1 replication initiation protein RepC [Rhizobium alarense]